MRGLPSARVFTSTELYACGWSEAAVARAVRSGRLLRLRRGVFASATADVNDPVLTIQAATLSCTGAVASHRSALQVHGLPLVGARPPVPEVTVSPRRIGALADAHLHRATLRAEDVTAVGGIPVTSIARTLIDVARHRPLGCAVAAMDAALHHRLVTPTELDDVALSCWHWPRIRRALRALRQVDGRSESPLESVSRLVLGWLRVPEPVLQAQIRDQGGRFVGRLDFYWPDYGVAGEADGATKYTEPEVLLAEKRRQEALEMLGLIVVRWGWTDVAERPHALAERLAAAFERGRRRDRSGFRAQWSVSAA